MKTFFAKLSSTARTTPWRLLLSFVVFITAATAGSARSADIAAQAWQGKYHSEARKEWVTVRLTLPANAKPGVLRFESLLCEVGLQPESAEQPGRSAAYNIQPSPGGEAAGPYCGLWLGGRVTTEPVNGGQRLRMVVTKGSKSKIELDLDPVPGAR